MGARQICFLGCNFSAFKAHLGTTGHANLESWNYICKGTESMRECTHRFPSSTSAQTGWKTQKSRYTNTLSSQNWPTNGQRNFKCSCVTQYWFDAFPQTLEVSITNLEKILPKTRGKKKDEADLPFTKKSDLVKGFLNHFSDTTSMGTSLSKGLYTNLQNKKPDC